MSELLHCQVVKSLRRDGVYIYLAAADALEDLPEALLSSCGPLQKVMELELHPARKLATANAADVLKSIAEKGYYMQLPPNIPEDMAALAAKNSKLL